MRTIMSVLLALAMTTATFGIELGVSIDPSSISPGDPCTNVKVTFSNLAANTIYSVGGNITGPGGVVFVVPDYSERSDGNGKIEKTYCISLPHTPLGYTVNGTASTTGRLSPDEHH